MLIQNHRPLRVRRYGLGLMASVAILAACAAPDPEPEQTENPPRQVEGELFVESMELENGETLEYDRGVIQVPVRRADESTNTLDLEFFRLRRQASAGADTPPIMQLRGGPGFEGLGPLLERPGYYENLLERYTRVADLVVVGQRGFGTSSGTPCEPARAMDVEEALDDTIRRQVMLEAGQACRQHWEEQGLDLAGFTVLEAADDVIDVADFLGYDAIQVWGVSFGSHWGMTVVQRHPERVARATFGGLEGPDHTYDMPSGVLAAMERIAASAESEPALGLPPEGLLEAYAGAIQRLDEAPTTVTLELDPSEVDGLEEPRTVDVELDGDILRDMLAASRRFTGFRHRSLGWPGALNSVIQGDYDGAATMWVESRLAGDLPAAAFFMLDCGSGLSQARGNVLRNDPAAAMLGPMWLGYDEACVPWDADLGEDFRQPFDSSVPTVLIQGNWDTSTPYENAVEAREFFDNHHFVHVEGGSHGALREALEQIDDFEADILHWLTTGEFEQLPESIELPPMEWVQDTED